MEKRRKQVIIKVTCGNEPKIEFIDFEPDKLGPIVSGQIDQDSYYIFNYSIKAITGPKWLPNLPVTKCVGLCADFFGNLPEEKKKLNVLGTILYGNTIMGDIVIMKKKCDPYQELDFGGFDFKEYKNDQNKFDETAPAWEHDMDEAYMVAEYLKSEIKRAQKLIEEANNE